MQKNADSFTPHSAAAQPGPSLERIRAVAVGRYPIWLEAIEQVLLRTGLDGVTAVSSPDRALDAVEASSASLLVIDTGGDDVQPVLEEVRRIRRRRPAIRVILLAEQDDLQLVEQAFDAGVFAYLLRTADAQDLAAAVRQAFSPSIFLAGRGGPPADRARPVRQEDLPPLTRRELEILRLAAAGRSNAELARTLWVTEQTVKFHLSNVYRKLGVSNRTEAARWAQLHGLLDGDAESVPAR